jgi:purine-nucleoside phosphorylase
MRDKLERTLRYIRERTENFKPDIAIILGSGLGELAAEFEGKIILDARDIPCYPVSTVEGHYGRLVFGRFRGKRMLGFQGRIHFYESGRMEDVIYPVLVASQLGSEILIVTNSAGGLNKNFKPGDFMVIIDHINFMFLNPLLILSESFGDIFDKISDHPMAGLFYDVDLIDLAVNVGVQLGIPVREGIYCGVRGPSYETPSEVEMLRRIGADAVGMSTIPEVITASYLKMKVLGISCITNLAAGISGKRLSHREVTEMANKVKNRFAMLIGEIVGKI